MPGGPIPTCESLRADSAGSGKVSADIKVAVVNHHVVNDDETALQERQCRPVPPVPDINLAVGDSGWLSEKSGRVELVSISRQCEHAIGDAWARKTIIPMFVARGRHSGRQQCQGKKCERDKT